VSERDWRRRPCSHDGRGIHPPAHWWEGTQAVMVITPWTVHLPFAAHPRSDWSAAWRSESPSARRAGACRMALDVDGRCQQRSCSNGSPQGLARFRPATIAWRCCQAPKRRRPSRNRAVAPPASSAGSSDRWAATVDDGCPGPAQDGSLTASDQQIERSNRLRLQRHTEQRLFRGQVQRQGASPAEIRRGGGHSLDCWPNSRADHVVCHCGHSVHLPIMGLK